MATDPEREHVATRAQWRCEYCRAPEDVTGYAFHIEHIKPASEGGQDHVANYALSCASCNFPKATHQTGVDPISGQQVRLFNPRKHKWRDHFKVERKIIIKGKTSVGRATVSRLKMNSDRQ